MISKEEMILFSNQLAMALESDIPLTDGLTIILDKTDNKDLERVLDSVIDRIHDGESFADAMKAHEDQLSDFYIRMIEIGERSGNLPDILQQISKNYERELEMQAQVKQAIAYPMILSILMLGVIVLLIVQVMPMFENILLSLGGEIPLFTQVILSTSRGLTMIGPLLLILIFSFIVFVFRYRKTSKGKAWYDKLLLKTPYIKDIQSAMIASRFARNLGLLIQSGTSISKGFEFIEPIIDNHLIEEKVAKGKKAIDDGHSLEEVVESFDLFPSLLVKLFSVASQTGQMDRALFKAAKEMDKELDVRLRRITTVLEPMLIIILSIIVGVILISVVLPVIDIMNRIG